MSFRKRNFQKEAFGKVSPKKPLRKASSKAQSAMEYLMTYGWAILIISVVLAALYQLGVFNPMTFAPKAPPGSCQVFRPNGPYTTSFINLEGICSGELPQYVAQFNGENSYINIGDIPSLRLTQLTLEAWIKPMSNELATGADCISRGNSCGSADYGISFENDYPPRLQLIGTTSSGFHYLDFLNINSYIGKWMQVIYVYEANGTWLAFINGQLIYSTNVGQITITSGRAVTISWPAPSTCGGAFNGSIANVQIYNTSLSANEIQALYLEGIGGAPIDLQHLVAWWPLNGNANDYSGNGNNGQAYNVSFESNWYSAYTPP